MRMIIKLESPCCEKNLNESGISPGQARDGQRWVCPDCQMVWEHQCDEAEGCAWRPVRRTKLMSQTLCRHCQLPESDAIHWCDGKGCKAEPERRVGERRKEMNYSYLLGTGGINQRTGSDRRGRKG